MVYRPRFPDFARQFDDDTGALANGRATRLARFGDRLAAWDRAAGTFLLTCMMILAVWMATHVAGLGLLEIPSAAARAADAVAMASQNSGFAKDRLTWTNVRDLQIRLTELGFDPGKIDGMAGRRTLDALNLYRAAQSLRPVSWVDRTTIAGVLD